MSVRISRRSFVELFQTIGNESNNRVAVHSESESACELLELLCKFFPDSKESCSPEIIHLRFGVETSIRKSDDKLDGCHGIVEHNETLGSDLLHLEFLLHGLEYTFNFPSLKVRATGMRIGNVRNDSHRLREFLVLGDMEKEIMPIFPVFLRNLYTVYSHREIFHLPVGIGDRIQEDSIFLRSNDEGTPFGREGIEVRCDIISCIEEEGSLLL